MITPAAVGCKRCESALHCQLNEFVGKALPDDSKLRNGYGKRETPGTCTARVQKEDPATNLDYFRQTPPFNWR